MNENLKAQLITTAQTMRQKARVPYSHYSVGAAVLTISDTIIGGCNVESASFSLTCCAERVALFRALAEGHSAFKALAVATANGGFPCGACRQVIWELCGDIPVYIADQDTLIRSTTSKELLPDAFGPENLE